MVDACRNPHTQSGVSFCLACERCDVARSPSIHHPCRTDCWGQSVVGRARRIITGSSPRPVRTDHRHSAVLIRTETDVMTQQQPSTWGRATGASLDASGARARHASHHERASHPAEVELALPYRAVLTWETSVHPALHASSHLTMSSTTDMLTMLTVSQ